MPAFEMPQPIELRSVAEQMAELAEAQRLEALQAMTSEQIEFLPYNWQFWGRPKQQEPDMPYFCWMLLAGRGYGKTRVGAQWVRKKVEAAWRAGTPIRIALVAETAADARDVLVMGESGILASARPDFMPKYEPSKRRVTWPDGSMAFTFSGDEPGQLRGPQFHYAWVDEIAKYQYPTETLDNLEFGLRLGTNPQMCVTTTPRPIPVVRALLDDEHTVVTRGSSYENIANLATSFIHRVIHKYEGTRTGRQELHAEVLTDTPGALWTNELIEKNRVSHIPEMKRIVIGVDPAVTSTEESDETGIVVCGLGVDNLGYVLADSSAHYSPDGWAREVKKLYEHWKADRVVAEVNNGGDLVGTVLRTVDRDIPFRPVHASRGKTRRAEPVAALYEQFRIKHFGQFAKLEDQMTTYTEDTLTASGRRIVMPSPDRMDALVWACSSLMLNRGSTDRRRPSTYSFSTLS